MSRHTNLFLMLLLGFSATASALDYRSVAVPSGVLFDTPSIAGKKLFVVHQGYPVEVIVELGAWLKVRDKTGSLAWIESKNLVTKRTLLTLEKADVHETPDTGSDIVFRVDKDVLLEPVEPSSGGWVKIRHKDGLTGFVLSSQVWGL